MKRAHGWSGYMGGCRCGICKRANAERARVRRAQVRDREAAAPAGLSVRVAFSFTADQTAHLERASQVLGIPATAVVEHAASEALFGSHGLVVDDPAVRAQALDGLVVAVAATSNATTKK